MGTLTFTQINTKDRATHVALCEMTSMASPSPQAPHHPVDRSSGDEGATQSLLDEYDPATHSNC